MTDPKDKKREITPEFREFATLMLEAMKVKHTIEQKGDKTTVTLDFDDMAHIILEMNEQHNVAHHARLYLSRHNDGVRLADHLDSEIAEYRERVPATEKLQEFQKRLNQKANNEVLSQAADKIGGMLIHLGVSDGDIDPSSMN